MTYHQHRTFRIGPSCCLQNRLRGNTGADFPDRLKIFVERGSRLLGTLGWADNDARVLWQSGLEPSGHEVSLFSPFIGKFPCTIGNAIFSLGMTPQYELHELLLRAVVIWKYRGDSVLVAFISG